jgi:hypothetical protein
MLRTIASTTYFGGPWFNTKLPHNNFALLLATAPEIRHNERRKG